MKEFPNLAIYFLIHGYCINLEKFDWKNEEWIFATLPFEMSSLACQQISSSKTFIHELKIQKYKIQNRKIQTVYNEFQSCQRGQPQRVLLKEEKWKKKTPKKKSYYWKVSENSTKSFASYRDRGKLLLQRSSPSVRFTIGRNWMDAAPVSPFRTILPLSPSKCPLNLRSKTKSTHKGRAHRVDFPRYDIRLIIIKIARTPWNESNNDARIGRASTHTHSININYKTNFYFSFSNRPSFAFLRFPRRLFSLP